MRECKLVEIASDLSTPGPHLSTKIQRRIAGTNGQHGFFVSEDPAIQAIINGFLKEGWSIASGYIHPNMTIQLLLTR